MCVCVCGCAGVCVCVYVCMCVCPRLVSTTTHALTNRWPQYHAQYVSILKRVVFLAKLSIAWDYKSAIVIAFLLCGSMCILHLKYTSSDGFSAVVTPDFLHNHLVPKSVLSSKGMY